MSLMNIDGQPYEARKVIEHGGSLAITLPLDWVLAQGVEKGNVVLCEYVNGNLLIHLAQVSISLLEASDDKTQSN